MKLTIDLGKLIGYVRHLANEKPTFCYGSHGGACLYTANPDYLDKDPQTPIKNGCIIGQALILYNPIIKPFLRFVDQGGLNRLASNFSSSMSPTHPRNWLEFITFVGDDQQKLWLSCVQSEQDAETPWGKAVEVADELYPLD